MKILLLGAKGMLGQSIAKTALTQGIELIGVDREGTDYNFDLLNDIRLESTIKEVKPDIIINTAAIVSLEFCEGNPGQAYCINARLPGVLGTLSDRYGAYLIHVSTDHYYSGDVCKAHTENCNTVLLNEYARTKNLGEYLALKYSDTLILRTNIVGFRGLGAPTFLEWAIKEIESNNRMTLYTDFYTSSIHVNDFAKILFEAIKKHPTGVYNLSSGEISNKKEFILGLSRGLFGYDPQYIDGSVMELKGAKRAESLGLDNSKLENLIGYKMPSLKQTIESIKKEYYERREKGEI